MSTDAVRRVLREKRALVAGAGSGIGLAIATHLSSAGALRYPAARLDAARCGIALYGISPFGGNPTDDDLRPALSWESELAQVKDLLLGKSTGYGRRYVAERPGSESSRSAMPTASGAT